MYTTNATRDVSPRPFPRLSLQKLNNTRTSLRKEKQPLSKFRILGDWFVLDRTWPTQAIWFLIRRMTLGDGKDGFNGQQQRGCSMLVFSRLSPLPLASTDFLLHEEMVKPKERERERIRRRRRRPITTAIHLQYPRYTYTLSFLYLNQFPEHQTFCYWWLLI